MMILEILILWKLWNFKNETRRNVSYTDVSPPIDESTPKHLQNVEYWKRAKGKTTKKALLYQNINLNNDCAEINLAIIR